jgi:hypothetical protein
VAGDAALLRELRRQFGKTFDPGNIEGLKLNEKCALVLQLKKHAPAPTAAGGPTPAPAAAPPKSVERVPKDEDEAELPEHQATLPGPHDYQVACQVGGDQERQTQLRQECWETFRVGAADVAKLQAQFGCCFGQRHSRGWEHAVVIQALGWRSREGAACERGSGQRFRRTAIISLCLPRAPNRGHCNVFPWSCRRCLSPRHRCRQRSW